jgi:hypothetical protein
MKDYINSNVIFTIWLGDYAMTPNRIQGLFSIISNANCPILFVNNSNYISFEKKNAPYHPALKYLSPTHQADYLRVYFMHNYGGGYSDIKSNKNDWQIYFDNLRKSNAFCLGYTEISSASVAAVGGELENDLRQNYTDLIGLCSFIFKKETSLTKEWIGKTEDLLDIKLKELSENPACHPLDRHGVQLPNGDFSKYPLKWTELLGNIFHPLIYKHKDKVIHGSIEPIFSNYR